jgi:hypothetical protein
LIDAAMLVSVVNPSFQNLAVFTSNTAYFFQPKWRPRLTCTKTSVNIAVANLVMRPIREDIYPAIHLKFLALLRIALPLPAKPDIATPSQAIPCHAAPCRVFFEKRPSVANLESCQSITLTILVSAPTVLTLDRSSLTASLHPS